MNMKTVREIYSAYRIMPSLGIHQLRVAAVAKAIRENFTEPLNEHDVLVACLFHDMGNIIKSDLEYFPEFLEPEGLEYWQKVKDEFVRKYGTDEHRATQTIVKEIGISDVAFSYLSAVGYQSLERTLRDPSFEKKICAYADMRVDPYRVCSIEERISEGRKRYAERKDKAMSPDRLRTLDNALRELEKQILKKTKIKPEDINEEKTKSIIAELECFEI